MAPRKKPDTDKLERAVAEARRARETRAAGYRERALQLFPWVCARCGREFSHETVSGLTVHHKDHDHDNNPPDGSNWELLCLYCHDNEHSRLLDAAEGGAATEDRDRRSDATYKPFADLKDRLKNES